MADEAIQFRARYLWIASRSARNDNVGQELCARKAQIAAIKTALARGRISSDRPISTGMRIALISSGENRPLFDMEIMIGAIRWPTIRIVSQGAASSERMTDQSSWHSGQESTCFR